MRNDHRTQRWSRLRGPIVALAMSSMNLRIIQHLNSQFQLVVEGVGQHQGVALVGFEQASWLSLDVDDIDEQIQFLQILLQRPVIVACPLQKNEVRVQRSQLAQALDEPTKACRGEQGNERTASVRWVDRSESVEVPLSPTAEKFGCPSSQTYQRTSFQYYRIRRDPS